MSRSDTEQKSASGAVVSSAANTHLSGRRLILARVTWVAVVTLIVALFLVMLPAYYALLQTVCTAATCAPTQPTPDSAQGIQKLGLSLGAYATFTLALTLALAFLCIAVSAVIFWRRSDDWMALLAALGGGGARHLVRHICITGEPLCMASARHRLECTRKWSVFPGRLTLS